MSEALALTSDGERAITHAKRVGAFVYASVAQGYRGVIARALPESVENTQSPLMTDYALPRVHAENLAYIAGISAGLGGTSITLENTLAYLEEMTFAEMDEKYPDLGLREHPGKLPIEVATFLKVTGIIMISDTCTVST